MTNSTLRVRFAPSPTGYMHVGHLRAALPNALVAQKESGTFVLRFEDTDIERQVDGAEEKMIAALNWLGLPSNENIAVGGDYGPYNTLARAERGDYKNAIQTLLSSGRAYECFASTDELDVMRKLQRNRNEPPRYDNRHRDLTEAEKEAFRNEGRQPVIRFKLNDETIVFRDLVRGAQKFEAKNLGGDPVIVRSNGIPLFTLAGVVDDINMNITHVIRGEDHVVNTAQQVQIFAALGAELPVFAHLPMMLDAEGQKMSKRLGSLTIDQLKTRGFLPQAICSYMAGLGFSEAPPTNSMSDLANWFDLSKIGRAPVRFDEQQLVRLNAGLLHKTSFADIKDQLPDFLPAEALTRQRLEAFWNSARENIETLADLTDLYNIAFEAPASTEMPSEDVDFIKEAANHLPAEPLTPDSWGTWTNTLKEATGRKGKGLFMPLRLALTGQAHGPDMANLLPVIGHAATLERLKK